MADGHGHLSRLDEPAPYPKALHGYLEFDALASSVRGARQQARHLLQEWGLHELASTTELLVSELVTNAVKTSAGNPGPRSGSRSAVRQQ